MYIEVEEEHSLHDHPRQSRWEIGFILHHDRGRVNIFKIAACILTNTLYFMSNNPRTAGIASFLRRYYAEHKRVSVSGFCKAADKVLTNKEANEIFEYMTCIKICLLPSTKRMYTWTCKQDHFNDIAVGEMLDFINLREKKDERHKKEIHIPTDEERLSMLAGKSFKFTDGPVMLEEIKPTLDDLVRQIEAMGWEVTLKHIIK